MIKKCFNKLKLELENKGIKNLDIFMNCIFKDLFEQLHNKECINNYEELIIFEDQLELLIQSKCKQAYEEIKKYKELIKVENSSVALIKEIYDINKYKNKEFPFYEYFYYTDYLDEDYIYNILKNKDENNYPVLAYYLQNIKQETSLDKDNIKDNYSLDNLYLFNRVLNLFNDTYSNKISKESSQKITIKTCEIYNEEKNYKLINDFIDFYNHLEIKDDNGNKLQLDLEKNYIIDFLLTDENKYKKSYINIYNIFIDKQNKELESLFDKKINSGELDVKCKNKINVHQIKENEIFSLTKKFNFNEIIFNSSYRRYIDTEKYENYNEYEINLKKIEKEMTNSLLKNKKLLSYEMKEFYFSFDYGIRDIICNFGYEKRDINIDDKMVIYKFIEVNEGNNEKYKNIINNFITLIEYLNKESKNKNNNINENTKICDIEIVKNLKNISKDFKEIFQDEKNDLNVNKIIIIFDYFLKLIFKYVKEDIEKYQEKNKNEEYNFDDKDMTIIKKRDLANAIRLFITLVLFRENENNKDIRIKSNEKNIIDYLKNKDLWEPSLYNDKLKFEKDLTKIKNFNIKIKEILFFYYYLMEYEDEEFEDEIKKYMERENKIEREESDDDDSDVDSEKDSENSSDGESNALKRKNKSENKPSDNSDNSDN